jgi:hypothetical protein
MENLKSLKSSNVFFPELDRSFLSLTEKLIIKAQNYRRSENWPRFLLKLKQAEITYAVIHKGQVFYSKEIPEGNFTETINVEREFSKLNADMILNCQPDVPFIRTFTGLNQSGSSNRSRVGVIFLKSESLSN